MTLLRRPPKPDLDEPHRLHELELLARWMDTVFVIPGTGVRFGFDAIIGLIPGLGDAISSLVSFYILGAARRYGLPRATLARMALNIGVDYLAGSVPLAGDVFDVFWKANQKNVALLRRHLATEPLEARRARIGDRVFVGLLIAGLAGVLALTLFGAFWFVRLIARSLGAAV